MKKLALLFIGFALSAQDAPISSFEIKLADYKTTLKMAYACGVLDGSIKVAKASDWPDTVRKLEKLKDEVRASCDALGTMMGIQ